MTVYVDLIFFINFFYDLLLMLTVSSVLKRRVKFYRHLLSAFLGAVSLGLLFINTSNFILFIMKILISIGMCLVSFNYISLRYTFNNLTYLYMASVILAGFLYFLNVEFSYAHVGMLFIFEGMSINYIVLLIIAPVILFYYLWSNKKIKNTYSLYYHVDIVFDEQKISCLALFDNGNSLKDPVSGKAVIIVSPKLLKGIYNIRSPIYVPYSTVSGSALMRCFKPSFIMLNNHKIYNYLVGESNYRFNDGINCILNIKLLEDNYV